MFERTRLLPVLVGMFLVSMSCGDPASDRTVQPSEVTVEYVAHAAFRIRSPEGSTVIIDPFADRVWLGYDFPRGLEADAILITHPHYDHDAGQRMGRPLPWGDSVQVFRDPGTFRVGDITIHGVRGKHADPYGKEFGQINTIWVVETAGRPNVRRLDTHEMTFMVDGLPGETQIVVFRHSPDVR